MSYNLPVKTDYSAKDIVDAIAHDKKNCSSGQKMVLLHDAGDAYIETFDRTKLYEFISEGLE